MVSFPHCKINLGLRILGKRKDGYHDLETVFYPLALFDALEIVRSEQPAFTASGLPIPGEQADNLCSRAYALLKNDFPDLPFVHAFLYKQIPMGAGLGGGSSDGAFMLRGLNTTFRLGLDQKRLAGYALQLGSDCPFFVGDNPCYATGRGEMLEPLTLDLSEYALAVVHPGVPISTAEAYAAAGARMALGNEGTDKGERISLREVVGMPIAQWRGLLVNDFEEWACTKYPELDRIRDRLYEAGATYASMTGSGSAFFGLFPKTRKEELRRKALFPPDYFFRIL